MRRDLKDPSSARHFGFLYKRFEPEWYWWELVQIWFKFMLIVIKVMLSDTPSLQLICAAFIVFTSSSCESAFSATISFMAWFIALMISACTSAAEGSTGIRI